MAAGVFFLEILLFFSQPNGLKAKILRGPAIWVLLFWEKKTKISKLQPNGLKFTKFKIHLQQADFLWFQQPLAAGVFFLEILLFFSQPNGLKAKILRGPAVWVLLFWEKKLKNQNCSQMA